MPHDRIGADADRKANAEKCGEPAYMPQAAVFVPGTDRDQPPAVLQRQADKAAASSPDRTIAALTSKLSGEIAREIACLGHDLPLRGEQHQAEPRVLMPEIQFRCEERRAAI